MLLHIQGLPLPGLSEMDSQEQSWTIRLHSNAVSLMKGEGRRRKSEPASQRGSHTGPAIRSYGECQHE